MSSINLNGDLYLQFVTYLCICWVSLVCTALKPINQNQHAKPCCLQTPSTSRRTRKTILGHYHGSYLNSHRGKTSFITLYIVSILPSTAGKSSPETLHSKRGIRLHPGYYSCVSCSLIVFRVASPVNQINAMTTPLFTTPYSTLLWCSQCISLCICPQDRSSSACHL